jgi:hypothetical protein
MILPLGSSRGTLAVSQETHLKSNAGGVFCERFTHDFAAKARRLVPPLGLSRGISLFAEPKRLPTGPVPASVIINERKRREREAEKGAQIPLYVPPPPPPSPRDIDGNGRPGGDEGEKRGYVDITHDGNIDFSILN